MLLPIPAEDLLGSLKLYPSKLFHDWFVGILRRLAMARNFDKGIARVARTIDDRAGVIVDRLWDRDSVVVRNEKLETS